ncbi:hypothetical protein AM571_PC00962 (plasmid) [Rhizobium etli 8C-3]|uniref:Uncharacterized protein n=2 Tax=Rhizobium TaxID=379 RepID=A0A4R3QRJ0_9HYPH|nr:MULTISPECIES: hypothetical protein [Rhizobium]APO78698.1 hypothetical protein AM571_PC00962 [Rhizobium etli 8C-3]TCU24511.1 hypothetical protein EV130_106102 [Rhizobium azibense]TCU39259.1 hypothetical protein EV129_103104 [Rhizobium azibense]
MLSIQENVVSCTRRIGAYAVGLLCGLALAQPLASQSDRCQAPDQPQNPARAFENGTSPPKNGSSDTSKLSDCNGVLKPPSIGDGDLVKPAPPIGNTPVIRPDLPQQQ